MPSLEAMRAECAHESARLRLNRRICRSLRAIWANNTAPWDWSKAPHHVPYYHAGYYAALVEIACPRP